MFLRIWHVSEASFVATSCPVRSGIRQAGELPHSHLLHYAPFANNITQSEAAGSVAGSGDDNLTEVGDTGEAVQHRLN